MTDENRVDKAVRRFVELNSNETVAQSQREQAFDALLELLCWHDLPVRDLQIGSPKNDISTPEHLEQEPESGGSPSSRFLDLPAELHLQIISHLGWRSTTSVRLVSRYCCNLVTPQSVDWETSLLVHKLRCQELDHRLEQRLNAIFCAPDSAWPARQFFTHVPPSRQWAFRFPCYTCMRWLHGYNFVETYNLASFKYVKRYLFLSNRWPLFKGITPINFYSHVRPGLRLSYSKDVATRSRRYDPVLPSSPKARMCIHCAARKKFVPSGQLVGADGRTPSWIMCMCKKVFWRPDPKWWMGPSVFTASRRQPWFELVEYRPITLTRESAWRSFWWCEDCNAAGLERTKTNWLVWAHELTIGAAEARLERLEGGKIAQGREAGRMTKRWCPIVKEERYCRCAFWFVQEVWDGLVWPETEPKGDSREEIQRGISWVKYECRKALSEKRVRLRRHI